LLFKVYLNNLIFSSFANFSIVNILQKYIENETLHEFLIKFVKVALAMFYASEKKKKPKEKNFPLYNNKAVSDGKNASILPGEIESEISNAQKRALIV
jgi:hypothetical protein